VSRSDDLPLQHLFHPDNVTEYAAAVRGGLDHLTGHLDRVAGPATGVVPERAAKLVRDIDLDAPLGDTAEALDEVSRLWLDDAVWFHEPGYAAHLNCPVVVPALLGELLISSVNSSLDTFDQSVGGTFIERHLVDWTAARIGWDADAADGVFTSGGSQSNLHALLLARGHISQEMHAGAVSLDSLRIFASSDSHFSVQKSARLLGLGDAAVIAVPTDEQRRMDIVALGRAMAECAAAGLVPMAAVATAGTTDFGAIDPLPEISALCRTYGAWFHVDAAYGGGLLASTRRRHLLAGLEHADSVTVDYHKTWFQPISSSAVLVRDAATMGHASYYADYLNPADSNDPNQVDKSLQTTRRFDALKLWLTLRIMGPDTIGAYFDAVIDLAAEVYDAIAPSADVEVAARPNLSTLVFRYAPAGMGEDELALLNTRIRATLYTRGRAMVAATKVDGRQFLKFTLLNPKATRADIVGIVDQIRSIGEELVCEQIASRPAVEPVVAPYTLAGRDLGLLAQSGEAR